MKKTNLLGTYEWPKEKDFDYQFSLKEYLVHVLSDCIRTVFNTIVINGFARHLASQIQSWLSPMFFTIVELLIF